MNYAKGDLLCGKCGIIIHKKDIPNETHRGKDGRLLHECGYQLREGGRTSKETMRRGSHTHRSPIKFSRRYQIRSDILLNKSKWEQLIGKKVVV